MFTNQKNSNSLQQSGQHLLEQFNYNKMTVRFCLHNQQIKEYNKQQPLRSILKTNNKLKSIDQNITKQIEKEKFQNEPFNQVSVFSTSDRFFHVNSQSDSQKITENLKQNLIQDDSLTWFLKEKGEQKIKYNKYHQQNQNIELGLTQIKARNTLLKNFQTTSQQNINALFGKYQSNNEQIQQPQITKRNNIQKFLFSNEDVIESKFILNKLDAIDGNVKMKTIQKTIQSDQVEVIPFVNPFLIIKNEILVVIDFIKQQIKRIPLDIQENICASFIDCQNETIIICGGLNQQGDIKKSSFQYNLVTKKLIQIQDMIYERVFHLVVKYKKFVYVIGGQTQNDQYSKFCDKLDLTSNRWYSIKPCKLGRQKCSGIIVKDAIYVFGGSVHFNFSQVIEKYDIATDQWTVLDFQLGYNFERCFLFYGITQKTSQENIYIFQKKEIFKLNLQQKKISKKSFKTFQQENHYINFDGNQILLIDLNDEKNSYSIQLTDQFNEKNIYFKFID